MAAQSNIEWCDSTFNPWIGCTRISPACDNCYAAYLMDTRLHRVEWGPGKPRVRTSEDNWRNPKRWNDDLFAECTSLACRWRGSPKRNSDGVPVCGGCEEACHLDLTARRRIFCASLADVFDNEVPAAWRTDLFELIRITPNLDWLLLTKRPQNIVRMVRSHGAIAGNGTRYLPPNVWLGTTAEDQTRADINVPALLRCGKELGARVLFLSVEPMLGPIRIERATDQANGGTIDWVIAGGESGCGARPAHPQWFRNLRDECEAFWTPFFFKQWGEFVSVSEVEGTGAHYIFDDGATVRRVGKQNAGRTLDGRIHHEFPASCA